MVYLLQRFLLTRQLLPWPPFPHTPALCVAAGGLESPCWSSDSVCTEGTRERGWQAWLVGGVTRGAGCPPRPRERELSPSQGLEGWIPRPGWWSLPLDFLVRGRCRSTGNNPKSSVWVSFSVCVSGGRGSVPSHVLSGVLTWGPTHELAWGLP